MRRLTGKRLALAVIAVSIAGAGLAGCSRQMKPTAWDDPNASSANGASTPQVCGRIRAAISADMKPIGASLGALVGYTVADDDDERTKTTQKVQDQLKGLGSDISKAAAGAVDTRLKNAVSTSVANIDGLAGDSTFLANVSAVSDIQGISKKLDDATHPIAVACR